MPVSDGVAGPVHMPETLIRVVRRQAPSPEPVSEPPDYAWPPNPTPQVQAVGWTQQASDDPRTDHHARLQHASSLSPATAGLQVLSAALGRNYGTYELVTLLEQVGARFHGHYPAARLRVGDLSLKAGGTIRDHQGRRVHSSHRNGLDVDLRYLRQDCHGTGSMSDRDCPLAMEANLQVMRWLVEGGPLEEQGLVDVIFVSDGFGDRLCRWMARQPGAVPTYANVLDALQVMGGHHAHYHVRLRCPEHSRSCPQPRRVPRGVCAEAVSQTGQQGQGMPSG